MTIDKWVSKFCDGFCLTATRPQAALAECKCPHLHQFRRSPLEWMEARNGGASAGYPHTAGERKVSYFQTQRQTDVSNIQSAQRGGSGRRIAERGDGRGIHAQRRRRRTGDLLPRPPHAADQRRGHVLGQPGRGRDPGRRRRGLELVSRMNARRFVMLSWVLIACFGLDGCALVILPAQIALCASAPAGAGCQGMADLSAAEAGGRGGR